MDKLLILRQKRANAIAQMRALVANADKETRELNAEETARYESLRSEAEKALDDIKREEELRELEAATPAQVTASGPAAAARNEKLEDGIHLARFVKVSLLASSKRFAGESVGEIASRLYPQDTELRAMVEGTGGDGGYLVPQNLYSEIIPLLRQASVIRKLGATELPLPNGNLKIVKQTGAANFTWVGENKPIGNSKVGLGFVNLVAKKLAGIIPISNELLMDASLAADRVVRDEIVNGIAESEDITSLYGTGTENQPKGIVTACVANKVADTGEVTIAMMDNIVGKMLAVKLPQTEFAWRIPGVLWSKLRNLKDDKGNYAFRDEMKDGLLCGYPFVIDNNIRVNGDANKTTQIFFGSWKHFLIGVASELKISLSDSASYTVDGKQVSAFENDLTLMRGILREDFGVRYEEAFTYADGVATVAD